MADKTAAQKARVKPGTKIALLNPIAEVVGSLGLTDPEFVDPPAAQLVFLFVTSRSQLSEEFPAAVRALPPGAVVWVFFRKGSKAAGFDMSRNDVWAVAEELGLRPLGLVGVDDVWSAFRLKPGR